MRVVRVPSSGSPTWQLFHMSNYGKKRLPRRAATFRGTAMTVLSTLRQRTHPAIASFSKTYVTHRPLVQRILTAGFIANVLVTTFRGLLTRPSVPSSASKGKAREQSAPPDAGKQSRVAVRTSLFRPAHLFDFLVPRSTQCSIRDSLGSSGL